MPVDRDEVISRAHQIAMPLDSEEDIAFIVDFINKNERWFGNPADTPLNEDDFRSFKLRREIALKKVTNARR